MTAKSTKLLGRPKSHLSFSGSSSSLIPINFKPSKKPENQGSPHWATDVSLTTKGRNRLVPRSHTVQTHCFLFVTTKIMAFWENYLRPAKQQKHHGWLCSPSRGGFPSVLNANKLSHQQVAHNPPNALCKQQHKPVCLTCFQSHPTELLGQVHSKSAYPVNYRERGIIDSAQDKPVDPLETKAYSIHFNLCLQHPAPKSRVLLGQNYILTLQTPSFL